MKRIIFTGLLILLATLFIEAGPASSATGTMSVPGTVTDYAAGLAANGIVRSRHNMGAFGPVIHTELTPTSHGPGTGIGPNPGTTQVCVFCHTPHHSETGNNNPPLWNRVNTPTSYTAYGSTIGGTNINDADITGSSLACLSCHDGVTTFDTLVNAPGNGGITPGGSDQNWVFFMPRFSPGVDVTGLNFDHFSTGMPCILCHQNAGQITDTVSRLLVGTDLTNDHPVSVTYSANSKASLRPKNTLLSAIDLTTGLSNTNALSAYYQAMTQNRWAVKGVISETAHISDLLRNDKVECSSCHDPHFRNLSWDEGESMWTTRNAANLPGTPAWCGGVAEACLDGLFLRRVGGNTGSGVCRTCHDK